MTSKPRPCRAPCRRAEQPAEMQLRALWRAAFGHRLYRARDQNERTWCYRIRPSVKHTHRFTKIDLPVLEIGAACIDPMSSPWVNTAGIRCRIRGEALTWLTGMRTMTTAGDVNTQVGMASHVYLVTESMEDEYFFSRRQRIAGGAARGPPAVLHRAGDHRPRAARKSPFCRAGWSTGSRCWKARRAALSARITARSSSCRAAGRSAPTAWPTARDFKTPVAAFEDREVPSTVTVKWCGQFHETQIGHSPAGRGGLARQLLPGEIRSEHLLPGRRDPVRPPRSRRSLPC